MSFETFALIWPALSISTVPIRAQDTSKPPADNTKVNKRDRAKNAPTADQVKNNTSDRETMQKIRKALMDDKSLSADAHNVKIIAQNGKVTLSGPVALFGLSDVSMAVAVIVFGPSPPVSVADAFHAPFVNVAGRERTASA